MRAPAHPSSQSRAQGLVSTLRRAGQAAAGFSLPIASGCRSSGPGGNSQDGAPCTWWSSHTDGNYSLSVVIWEYWGSGYTHPNILLRQRLRLGGASREAGAKNAIMSRLHLLEPGCHSGRRSPVSLPTDLVQLFRGCAHGGRQDLWMERYLFPQKDWLHLELTWRTACVPEGIIRNSGDLGRVQRIGD